MTIEPDAKPDSTPWPKIPGYEIESPIGRGGMGRVYRARDLRLGRTVAIKCLLNAHDELIRDRFLDEARAVASLHHPQVAQLYEFRLEFTPPHIVMEFAAGGTLAGRMDGRPIDPKLAAKIIATLANAIEFAHRHGIVHRDLKPGNVLISDLKRIRPDTNEPEAEWVESFAADRGRGPPANGHGAPPTLDITFDVSRLRIADFGLARNTTSNSGLTQTGDILGTAEYMSPEQATGISAKIGPAADIYSLGAMLYEMLTGRPPFVGPDSIQTVMMLLTQEPLSPRAIVPRLPLDIQTICLKCLEKKPGHRYATALELALDLERFLRNEPIRARPVPAIVKLWKWSKRKPWQAVALTLIALLIVGGGIGLVTLQQAYRSLGRTNAQLVVANRDLISANQKVDEAFRLSQDGLQSIVGVVRDELYDIPQADSLGLTVVRQAAELSRRLSSIRPDDVYTARQLVQSLEIQRMTEWLAGNRQRAGEILLEMDKLLDRLCRQFPTQVDLATHRVRVWIDLADASKVESSEALEQKIEAALAKLLMNHARDPDVQKLASANATRLISHAAARGDIPGVLSLAQEQLAHARLYAELAAAEDLQSARAWLAGALIRASQYRTVFGDLASARKNLDEARMVLQSLPDEQKTERLFRDLEASCFERAAQLALQEQNYELAARELSAAASHYRSLVHDFPGDYSWRTALAGVVIQQAQMALIAGDADTTRAHLDDAAALTAAVLAQVPEDWLAQNNSKLIEQLRTSVDESIEKKERNPNDR